MIINRNVNQLLPILFLARGEKKVWPQLSSVCYLMNTNSFCWTTRGTYQHSPFVHRQRLSGSWIWSWTSDACIEITLRSKLPFPQLLRVCWGGGESSWVASPKNWCSGLEIIITFYICISGEGMEQRLWAIRGISTQRPKWEIRFTAQPPHLLHVRPGANKSTWLTISKMHLCTESSHGYFQNFFSW